MHVGKIKVLIEQDGEDFQVTAMISDCDRTNGLYLKRENLDKFIEYIEYLGSYEFDFSDFRAVFFAYLSRFYEPDVPMLASIGRAVDSKYMRLMFYDELTNLYLPSLGRASVLMSYSGKNLAYDLEDETISLLRYDIVKSSCVFGTSMIGNDHVRVVYYRASLDLCNMISSLDYEASLSMFRKFIRAVLC